jgi:hypothetical protein
MRYSYLEAAMDLNAPVLKAFFSVIANGYLAEHSNLQSINCPQRYIYMNEVRQSRTYVMHGKAHWNDRDSSLSLRTGIPPENGIFNR